MSHYLTNETISLSKYFGQTEYKNDLTIHVLYANHVVHHLLDAPETVLWIFCGSVWFFFLIGCYFRYILYDYMFQQLHEFKPINILTLLIAVLNHVHVLLVIIYLTLMVTNKVSLECISGGLWFFVVLIYFGAFAKIFPFVGRLMVAIYRILLIKRPYFVNYRIGQKNMLLIILFVGLTFTVFCVVLDSLNDYQHLRVDRCVPSVVNMRRMTITLDEYEQSRGRPSIYAYWRDVRIGLTTTGFAFIVAEITIYIIYFHHLYWHDNSENLRRILAPEDITRRNRRNAISFFTQFCSFMVELSWLVLLIITSIMGNNQNRLTFIRYLVFVLSFAMISMIEVLLSGTLRQRLFQLNIYNIIHGLN